LLVHHNGALADLILAGWNRSNAGLLISLALAISVAYPESMGMVEGKARSGSVREILGEWVSGAAGLARSWPTRCGTSARRQQSGSRCESDPEERPTMTEICTELSEADRLVFDRAAASRMKREGVRLPLSQSVSRALLQARRSETQARVRTRK
jgi:hypothetical protein